MRRMPCRAAAQSAMTRRASFSNFPMSNPADTLTGTASSLTAHRSFVLFWCARVFSVAAYMALTVGIGWQIYELTGSAFDLGLVGLAQFLPFVALPLLIGQVADRFHRPTVLRVWKLLDRAEYKRRQAPPGVKITARAFGRDRRYPITNGFTALVR